MKPQSPSQFSSGQLIQSVYTGHIFILVEPNNRGLAKLKTEYGGIETWNAHNNAHFIRSDGQRKLNIHSDNQINF